MDTPSTIAHMPPIVFVHGQQHHLHPWDPRGLNDSGSVVVDGTRSPHPMLHVTASVTGGERCGLGQLICGERVRRCYCSADTINNTYRYPNHTYTAVLGSLILNVHTNGSDVVPE